MAKSRKKRAMLKQQRLVLAEQARLASMAPEERARAEAAHAAYEKFRAQGEIGPQHDVFCPPGFMDLEVSDG